MFRKLFVSLVCFFASSWPVRTWAVSGSRGRICPTSSAGLTSGLPATPIESSLPCLSKKRCAVGRSKTAIVAPPIELRPPNLASPTIRNRPTGPRATPPIEPMVAKLAEALPEAGAFLFEPKWDGFRAIVFRSASDVYIQSRDLKPLDRYFPELHDSLLEQLPKGSVIDGEIVITTPRGLDFDALQMRLHPAASRVAKLANETPASFVAFDLLASGGRDRMAASQNERRALLEQLFAKLAAPLHLTP